MKKRPLLDRPGKIQFSKIFYQTLQIIRGHQNLPKYKISRKYIKKLKILWPKNGATKLNATGVYYYQLVSYLETQIQVSSRVLHDI